MRHVLVLLLLVVLASPATSGQAPARQSVFRGGVELVQIDVSVLDGKRQPVTGLTASDFTVLENGVPRPIRAFTAVDLPARAPAAPPWAHDAAPDVATNAVGDQDGRIVIILLDRTIPPQGPSLTARRTAVAIINALGPDDLAAVVSTSGGVPQNLTADKARLVQAVSQRDWSTAISKEAEDIPTMGKQDPLSDGRCLCGLCVLDQVTRISDAVRGAPRRRKVLFFIGSSLIVQVGARAPNADVGCDRLVRDARIAMLDSLSVSNLTVHSLDPAGITNVAPWVRAGKPGGQMPGAPEARLQEMRDNTTELLSHQESLHVLPDFTGGRTVINTNAPEEQVPGIVRESNVYYEVGFEPQAPGGAPRRSIEVKVARKGVSVHTQRQYIVPPSADGAGTPAAGAQPTPIDRALAGMLPSAGMPLESAVAAFAARDSAGARVTIDLGVGAFGHPDGTPVALDVMAVAVDQAGRRVASARQTSIVTTPAGTARGAAAVMLPTHLDLPPGDYEIRTAVADPAGAVASVFSPIVVPRFDSAPLSLSSVTVTAEGRTTTTRAFGRGHAVSAVLEIYQGTERRDPIEPVQVRVRVFDAANAAVRDETLTFAPAMFVERRATCRVGIPIEQLRPGDYLLRIDAAAPGGTTTRALRFAVEATATAPGTEGR
jgi:VWFA-related protein